MVVDFNFKGGPYLFAMREQAPKMFGELRKAGKLDEFIQERGLEAHQMLLDLLADKPLTPGSHYFASDVRWATEIAMALFLEFPKQKSQRLAEPPDDLLTARA